jgi:hypothetical protein
MALICCTSRKITSNDNKFTFRVFSCYDMSEAVELTEDQKTVAQAVVAVVRAFTGIDLFIDQLPVRWGNPWGFSQRSHLEDLSKELKCKFMEMKCGLDLLSRVAPTFLEAKTWIASAGFAAAQPCCRVGATFFISPIDPEEEEWPKFLHKQLACQAFDILDAFADINSEWAGHLQEPIKNMKIHFVQLGCFVFM